MEIGTGISGNCVTYTEGPLEWRPYQLPVQKIFAALAVNSFGTVIESPMIVSKKNYMEAGKSYLISNKGAIREWECLKESNKAYKIKDVVDYSYSSMFGSSIAKGGTVSWILKSDMYPLDNPQYEIIEEI